MEPDYNFNRKGSSSFKVVPKELPQFLFNRAPCIPLMPPGSIENHALEISSKRNLC